MNGGGIEKIEIIEEEVVEKNPTVPQNEILKCFLLPSSFGNYSMESFIS
jgi:hypothetical protein